MNTLAYYENYQIFSSEISVLEGQLQFASSPDAVLLERLQLCKNHQKQIEESLRNYIPYPLSARNHYKALEEQEFLFYRCIKGFTMSKTAELMSVSRDTAYRIRRRIASKEGWQASFFDDL